MSRALALLLATVLVSLWIAEAQTTGDRVRLEGNGNDPMNRDAGTRVV